MTPPDQIDANSVIEIQKQKIADLEWQNTLLQARIAQYSQALASATKEAEAHEE